MTTPLTATLAAPQPAPKKGRNLDWLHGLRSAKIVVGGTVFLLFVLVAIFWPLAWTWSMTAC
ncbi:hypothetical protein SB658_24680, partial [Bacillus sp. SIMBA_008]|uniref:hypothetical protein n=1 Tax=Bacillus sp. SIMBA_008 TaxID=3085757 RepID=UPI00397E8A37